MTQTSTHVMSMPTSAASSCRREMNGGEQCGPPNPCGFLSRKLRALTHHAFLRHRIHSPTRGSNSPLNQMNPVGTMKLRFMRKTGAVESEHAESHDASLSPPVHAMPLPRLGCGGPTRDMTPSGLPEDIAPETKSPRETVEKVSEPTQDHATAPCIAEVPTDVGKDGPTQSNTFASLLAKIAMKKSRTGDVKPARPSIFQGPQSSNHRESSKCPSALRGVSREISPDTVAQDCKDPSENDAEPKGEASQSPLLPASLHMHQAFSGFDARSSVVAQMPSSEQDCNGANRCRHI